MPAFRIATLFLAAALAAPALAESPALDGRWVSAAPEPLGPMFGVRDFTFENDQWSLVFTAYGDADATMPLFSLETGGSYLQGGPSAAVDGAHEAVFFAHRRAVTAQGEEGAAMFAGMGCELVPGEPKDLTVEACGFLPSVMSSMGEYDLIAVEEGQLYLGDRAGDLSKERPGALSPHPLVRE